MQNVVDTTLVGTKSQFKKEFKRRLYDFVLRLIEFLDNLPKDNVAKRVGDQLLRSSTSILGNYVEGQSASLVKIYYFTGPAVKRISQTISTPP